MLRTTYSFKEFMEIKHLYCVSALRKAANVLNNKQKIHYNIFHNWSFFLGKLDPPCHLVLGNIEL